MDVFERRESEVRSYCRSFPTIFDRAKGSRLWDEDGREYIDFFAGAGSLNYGHNPEPLKERLIRYLERDGITHGLDMATGAKRDFLTAIDRRVLRPRGLDYKVLFPGPTGTNAVEVALKLARRLTGRTNVVAFTNGFHGMTLGSLALTGNHEKREAAGVPLAGVSRMPFAGYFGPDVDTLEQIDKLLGDASSGVPAPAAFVVETIQAEGGVNVASVGWLRRLEKLARRHGALLVVDDIQVGCGRTGTFFSFEEAGLRPDAVCLSKSLSGFGLPLSVLLLRSELDEWKPGEHNGTFRGHNPAFVTATAALEEYWRDDRLRNEVVRKGAVIRAALHEIGDRAGFDVRGRGLIYGLVVGDGERAERICAEAFSLGLLIETSGPRGEVLKVLPPLTIDAASLETGLGILESAVKRVMATERSAAGVAVASTQED